MDHGGHSYWPFYLGTDGRINIQFQCMSAMPPFAQVAMREEFLRRLNEVPGVQLPGSAIDRRPGVPLKTLAAPEALAALFAAFEWFLSEAVKPPAASVTGSPDWQGPSDSSRSDHDSEPH